jgi:hypothetical protein
MQIPQGGIEVKISENFRWFDAMLIGIAAIISIVAVAALVLAPKQDSEGVAVVFAPWIGAPEALVRAVEPGGRFVRFGAFDFIAIVAPSRADYGERVRAAGAWLIADPATLAACLKPFARKS